MVNNMHAHDKTQRPMRNVYFSLRITTTCSFHNKNRSRPK